MSGVALERLSTLTLSVRQLGRLPHLSDVLSPWPPLKGNVRASDVPSLFREPYILSGYRPVGQEWRCYVFSLFQRHNETLNVWTHLLAVPLVLLRCGAFVGTWSPALDATALPLCLYVLSILTYLSCSVAAHLLQSHSELAHYSLFFLDYVGVAVYQYGCALAHYFYSSQPAWLESALGTLFLPGTALLGWLSCAGCCFSKSRYRRPYPPRRKVCQLIPTSLAYLLNISPVAHRLATSLWSDPALAFHALQVAFFLLAALFFSCPIPECFFPGRCDIMGQGHQIFHLFLALCTVSQQEALFRDFVLRGQAVLEVHGERRLLLACASFPILVLCSALTAWVMRRSVQKQLQKSQ